MNLKKVLSKLGVLLVLFCFLTTGFTYAQRITGKITGAVTDDEGVPLPGVTLGLSSPALMGGVHAQVTSEKGVYRFINLPPGTYKIVFSLEGFQRIERENIRVTVGRTVTENIILKPATLEESITVTAEGPIIDVTKSGISSTFDIDSIEKIPTGRGGFEDVIKQAPGFITLSGYGGSNRISAFGSNFESNMYQLDGVDVSNPDLGTSWVWVNSEIISEVETKGTGAPAEYGNFTGAVISVVTKSGGNKFEGSLAYYGQFQELRADNNPDKEAYDSSQLKKFLDGVFTLGGPIVKDRLWFYSSGQIRREKDSDWQEDPRYPTEYKYHGLFFKLSSHITNQHRFVGSFRYEYNEQPGAITEFETPEVVVSEIWDTYYWNAQYTWLISNNSLFELRYSGYSTGDSEMPYMGGDINNPAHWDVLTGISSGAPWYPWFWWGSRHTAAANFSYFAEDFLGGDHEFKFGVQYNRADSKALGGYSGGKVYLDWDGEPYLLYELNPFYYGGVTNNLGVFLDDSLKIGDRLTVNLGLRFDHSEASFPEYPRMDGWDKTSARTQAQDDLIVWNSFSPRIGLAFQLTPDNKTLLKASFGRYYDFLHAGHYESPGPAPSDLSLSSWDGIQWELYYFIGGETGYILDQDLKNPYSDQYQIGLERELLPNFSAGATFIYKKEKNLVGFENRGGIYDRVSMVSPDNSETYLVYNQTNLINEIWLTNPSLFGQTYKALMFTLNKRYSNNWLMNASLIWSHAEGIHQGAHSTSGFAQSAIIALYNLNYGKDPNDWINADGDLSNDRRWIFKLQLSYSFPWGILASMNYMYLTGRPVPKFVTVLPDQGRRVILAEPRGEERFKSLNMLDARLQKTFNIYNTVKLNIILDVFNLFNINTVTDYWSYEYWAANYLTPGSMPFPRRLQIGAQLQF